MEVVKLHHCDDAAIDVASIPGRVIVVARLGLYRIELEMLPAEANDLVWNLLQAILTASQ